MLTLADIRSELQARLVTSSVLPMHVVGFCGWVLQNQIELSRAIANAVEYNGQARRPEHIAALGYGAAAKLLSPTQIRLLDDEIDRLRGRSFFAPGRPLRFEVDGLALLGVALGAAAGTNEENKHWCLSILERSAAEVAGDRWQLGLIRAAQCTLGLPDCRIVPADLSIASAYRGLGTATAEDRADAWNTTVSLAPHSEGIARDAVRLAVFESEFSRVGQIGLATVTHSDVVKLLNAVSRGMKRWTFEKQKRTANSEIAQWSVENEYHVQNLLWAVLAPVLPDLEDEENLPSLGHKNPRADLGVPSLRTIIEVKFMRNRGQQALAKITEEIAADVSLYLSRTGVYDNIIAFVWDDAAQTEQHHELKSGLESVKGVSAAIILPRPSTMIRQK